MRLRRYNWSHFIKITKIFVQRLFCYVGWGLSKVKISKTKAFGGARSAKMENLIWDMEQYFTAARMPETDKLNITTMYLMGDAKIWCRTRNADDITVG